MRAHNVTDKQVVGEKNISLRVIRGARLRHLERMRNVSLITSQLVINFTSDNNVRTCDEMRDIFSSNQ